MNQTIEIKKKKNQNIISNSNFFTLIDEQKDLNSQESYSSESSEKKSVHHEINFITDEEVNNFNKAQTISNENVYRNENSIKEKIDKPTKNHKKNKKKNKKIKLQKKDPKEEEDYFYKSVEMFSKQHNEENIPPPPSFLSFKIIYYFFEENLNKNNPVIHQFLDSQDSIFPPNTSLKILVKNLNVKKPNELFLEGENGVNFSQISETIKMVNCMQLVMFIFLEIIQLDENKSTKFFL